MNFNELDNPAVDSDSGHSVDPEEQEHRYNHSIKGAPGLPSVPFDPEWVSPFTLPPLPAVRKTRGQRKLLRSPEERLHKRSTSSAYYAAAWGSPLATPSPNKSPHRNRLRQRSQDFETSSPLSLRSREFTPERSGLRDLREESNLDPSTVTSGGRKRASSWDKSISLSERFNWLSESDLSESEAEVLAETTPTRDTYLKSLRTAKEKLTTARSRSHQGQESVATITPETFNATENMTKPIDSTSELQAKMEHNLKEGPSDPLQPGASDKPLPNLPSISTKTQKVEPSTMATSPESPSRPRLQSMQSSQRLKRKVMWKGKTCVIALPLTDRESVGLPPLLTFDEIKQRMSRWVAEGYDINQLATGKRSGSPSGLSQSRPLFPDPSEMYAERKAGKHHVHIPDQSEWDAWVEYLKEEKLRALGVTPSNSEPPLSVQSPFSSTLSRVSSTFPSIAASPPIGTFSSNGNPIRIASTTFSPPLGHPTGLGSNGGSHIASPSISGYPPSLHAYKQSIAQQRMTSPYDYPISHPGSYGTGMRNTPGGYGVRQFSPPSAANLLSLGQVLSPLVPTIPSNDNGRGMASNPTMEQIHQQQLRQQQLHQHMVQHSRQFSYFPPPQSKSADQLPRTPLPESPSRFTPEIMHPTPRSHRHNLSAALQKGVDDAEAARTGAQPGLGNNNNPPIAESNVEKAVEEKTIEEEREPELPVLKRPETLQDVDDKSEIETNPSIAASPMLIDEQNPFVAPLANLQQIANALQPQSQHKPKPSTTKLNVAAPEFDPMARFSSSNFTFGAKTLEPVASSTSKVLVGGSRPPFATSNSSISKLNVEAPAFTPSFIAQSNATIETLSTQATPAKQSEATPSKSPFTFSSPIFNVDAPEFKPSRSFAFNPTAPSFGQDESVSFTSAGTIFGNVVVDRNSKVSRRGIKPVTITRPRSRESESEPEPESEEPSEDEEGRIGAPTDRQKRARRVGDEDDEELLFASSAPFDHSKGLSSKPDLHFRVIKQADVVIAEESKDEEAKNEEVVIDRIDEPIEVSVPVQASEEDVHETASLQNQSAALEAQSLPAQDGTDDEDQAVVSPVVSGSEHAEEETQPADVIERPSSRDERDSVTKEPEQTASLSVLQEDMRLDDKQASTAQSDADPIVPEIGHKSRSSLSALAKPFEFRPGAATAFVPKLSEAKVVTEPSKAKGLMASRFAQASPVQKPLDMTNKNVSPPPELYEYIKPEDTHKEPSSAPEQHFDPAMPPSHSKEIQREDTPRLVRSIEESIQREANEGSMSRSYSQSSKIDESMPSYEEIDAVMKQFENNPDLGVERDDTPIKSTPLIDMRLAPNLRSDAPSPSPRHHIHQQLDRTDWGLGVHRLNDGNDEVSDWNDEFSPRQEHKLQRQAQYFDNHVNDMVSSALESRLGPVEQTLQTIQLSLVRLLDKKPGSRGRRSLSTENKEASDADDEEDYNALEAYTSYRSRSPGRSQRKAESIRAIVMDAMAAYQQPTLEPSSNNGGDIRIVLEEVKALSQRFPKQQQQQTTDVRAVIEDVITNHPHFQAEKQDHAYEAVQESYNLKLESLESSLKEAGLRAEREAALKRQADNDFKQLNSKLVEAQQQANKDRKAAEDAHSTIAELVKEKEAYEALKSDYSDAVERNSALEDTLAEYRVSSDQFRNDIKLEHARNEDLIKRMHDLREDFNDKLESRQALRTKLDRLQEQMAQVLHDVHADEDEWRAKEHEHAIQYKTIQAALDHEIRHREKIELELDNLDKEHKENIRYKAQHEYAQQEIVRLQQQISKVVDENKTHQDKSFRLELELNHAKESEGKEVSQATARLNAELEAARATIESLTTDSDAQISRLQKRLDDAELDLEEQKAKYDNVTSEMVDSHNHALHESNQKRETALEEQHASHERKLNDLRERHTRALHNSSDDRHRLENQLNEKLAINEERAKHLESQVKDLQEQLEITKSAARAAVEAATAKAANLPTPAPSVVASPPQRLSGVSLQLIKGSDIPEKISPQAMRESIMVLQEQLQNREHVIEQLQSEIAELDKDAPNKIKERDNEISLLRELLSVRVDDLNEVIATLSQPDYDRDAVKNGAIRLRANIQMEQQLKERAATISGLTSSLPSISQLSSLAQSPRALPMAAAAAWGNWRKARDFSISAVSDIATNISQTPSKASVGSPSNFLAGIMTPPSTSQRTPPANDVNPISPPTMRPLATANIRKNSGPTLEARPLRIYSSQARTLSSRQAEKRRESTESSSSETSKKQPQGEPETPTTPLARKGSMNLDLGEDVDEDASPFDASKHDMQPTQDASRRIAMA